MNTSKYEKKLQSENFKAYVLFLLSTRTKFKMNDLIKFNKSEIMNLLDDQFTLHLDKNEIDAIKQVADSCGFVSQKGGKISKVQAFRIVGKSQKELREMYIRKYVHEGKDIIPLAKNIKASVDKLLSIARSKDYFIGIINVDENFEKIIGKR